MAKLSSVFEKLLFWFILAIFIFVPLYPKLPVFNIPKTFVAIRIEDFLIAFVLVLWSVYMLISGKWRALLKEKLIQLLILFFGIGAISVFSGYFLTHTLTWHLGVLHLFRRIELMMLMPVVYTILVNQKQVKTILWTLSGVTILVCLYAFGQQYLGWPVISTGNSEFSKGLILSLSPGARVNSTFAGHYDLAVFLVMAIILITSFFIGWRKIWFRIYLGALGGLSMVVLVMTAARLSFVALVVGAISVILLGKKWKYLLVVFAVMLIALIYPSQLRDRFVSTLKVNVLDQGQRYESNSNVSGKESLNIPTLAVSVATESGQNAWGNNLIATDSASESSKLASDIAPGEPIDSTQLGVFRSFQIRIQIEWPRALNAFYVNPLLGTGYSSLGIATDNDILRSLGEVGILGTLVLVLIHLEILKRLFKLKKSTSKLLKYLSIGLIGVVFAFVVNSTFIDVYEASKIATIFWMLMGIALSASNYEKNT